MIDAYIHACVKKIHYTSFPDKKGTTLFLSQVTKQTPLAFTFDQVFACFQECDEEIEECTDLGFSLRCDLWPCSWNPIWLVHFIFYFLGG